MRWPSYMIYSVDTYGLVVMENPGGLRTRLFSVNDK